MLLINTEIEVSRLRVLCREMVDDTAPTEFSPAWIRSKDWTVVPVEDTGHLSAEEISILIPALKAFGTTNCVAVMTEDLDEKMPLCSRIELTENDFLEFNKTYGVFRCVVTDASRSWAILCNEWYNLYAAPHDFLQRMLGKPIEEAQREFAEFVDLLKVAPDDPIVSIARRYFL